jgi:hypothetical protein
VKASELRTVGAIQKHLDEAGTLLKKLLNPAEKPEKALVSHRFTIIDMHCAKYLDSTITHNFPNLKPRKEKDLETWADSFRKMREIDKIGLDELTALLKWSQESTFWQKNILSGAKFREKYQTLLVHSANERDIIS